MRPQTYGTRELKAGDEVEMPYQEALARILKKTAQFAPKTPKAMPKPQPKPETERVQAERMVADAQRDLAAGREVLVPLAVADEKAGALDRLRAEATALGIEVDGRWGILRLEHEIAQTKRQ